LTDLTWVLQSNAINEGDLASLTEALNALGIRVEKLSVVPFSHEPAQPLPVISGPCIAYGSSGLLKVARNAGWQPAGWDGPNFDASFANGHLGKLALNNHAEKAKWSKIAGIARAKGWNPIFVRPNSETKEFAGKVYELEDLERWLQTLKDTQYHDEGENDAIVSPAVELGREWRAFVVENEQISVCQYANKGVSDKVKGAPGEVSHFITQVIDKYSPAPCFVVDIAETISESGQELRVVEFNSINSAGFYLCDTKIIVEKLSAYVDELY
tara:strand:+ start:2039 stop:2848 length:810 start_codon:yes stop_codon:yes gene_type:complete